MNKTILVTGGGRGIGASIARLAAKSGYRVCVNYRRNAEAAQAVVAEILNAGQEAIAIAADVANESEVVQLFETIDQTFGPICALVNNAGVLETQMRVEAMTAERLQRVLATNVIGPFLCSREAVQRMSTKNEGKGGSIVNVSSRASQLGSPGEYVDYAASKGALDTLTIGLSKEVADEGIRVNAVRPGFIYTEMHASGGEPNRIERLKSSIPMKRGGSPDEVAKAVLWLLSDDASFVTGTFIDVAGGR